MNEQDFRTELRRTMATNQEPPPMSEVPVLDAAHRDRTRRRAMLAGIGSAAAVAVIAVGVVIVAPSGSGGGGVDVAVQPTDTTAAADTTNTQTSWPNGQSDRTARSGPEFDRGVTLSGLLDEVLPPGYGSPDDLVGPGGYDVKRNQAQYVDTVNGTEVWEYSAATPLTKDDGVGEMFVSVHTPGSWFTGDGCELLDQPQPFIFAECTEIVVDDKRVAVSELTNVSRKPNQTACYRHEDGTVVLIGQTLRSSAGSPLASLPLTAQRLAELATDPRFNFD